MIKWSGEAAPGFPFWKSAKPPGSKGGFDIASAIMEALAAGCRISNRFAEERIATCVGTARDLGVCCGEMMQPERSTFPEADLLMMAEIPEGRSRRTTVGVGRAYDFNGFIRASRARCHASAVDFHVHLTGALGGTARFLREPI